MTDFDVSERLGELIAYCVANLPESDRAARIAYCQRTGQHGVRAAVDGEDLVLSWGGARLAVIPVEALNDPTSQIASQYVPAAPDDLFTLGDL